MNTHEQVLSVSSPTSSDLARRAGLILSVLLLASVGVSLTGCNTTEGAGKDIQKAGEAIEDAAD